MRGVIVIARTNEQTAMNDGRLVANMRYPHAPAKGCSPTIAVGDDAADRVPLGERHLAQTTRERNAESVENGTGETATVRPGVETPGGGGERAAAGDQPVSPEAHGPGLPGSEEHVRNHLVPDFEGQPGRSGGPSVSPLGMDRPAHLIERAADRLVRMGGLEGPLASLMQSRTGPIDGDTHGFPLSGLEDPGEGSRSASIDMVALERAGLMDWSRSRNRISEEFRLAQRQLLTTAFAAPHARPGFSNLILVTSARPGEGKSFTSLNLAGSVSRWGDHSVLLVDADSKHDSFCYPLGLADAAGLLDLAANPKLDADSYIIKTPLERLSILPIGRERGRAPELFSSKAMSRLIQDLGRRYADRLVILDAPPCLSTSDAAVLAAVVGQVLMVVEAERTQREEVESSLEVMAECPNVVLMLNKQRAASRFSFGSYASYYSS